MIDLDYLPESKQAELPPRVLRIQKYAMQEQALESIPLSLKREERHLYNHYSFEASQSIIKVWEQCISEHEPELLSDNRDVKIEALLGLSLISSRPGHHSSTLLRIYKNARPFLLCEDLGMKIVALRIASRILEADLLSKEEAFFIYCNIASLLEHKGVLVKIKVLRVRCFIASKYFTGKDKVDAIAWFCNLFNHENEKIRELATLCVNEIVNGPEKIGTGFDEKTMDF